MSDLPCKKCGSTDRYKPHPGRKIGHCRPCNHAYRLRNLEKIQEYDRNRGTNKAKIYMAKRLKEDINFRVRHNLRTRIRRAIEIGQKSGSAVFDLGCSIDELKKHLERSFYLGSNGEWMSWECYGQWHIDHIKPLSSFDLTDRTQFLQACHYTNLQPLWAKDNASKGSK